MSKIIIRLGFGMFAGLIHLQNSWSRVESLGNRVVFIFCYPNLFKTSKAIVNPIVGEATEFANMIVYHSLEYQYESYTTKVKAGGHFIKSTREKAWFQPLIYMVRLNCLSKFYSPIYYVVLRTLF